MAAVAKMDELSNSYGTFQMDVAKIASAKSRYNRQTLNVNDTTDRTSGTTWTLGGTFESFPTFKAYSLLKISYMYPARNDQAGWGGLYFEPQIRFNSGTWQSLGSRGYDAVMTSGVADINYTTNVMLIDPALASDFTVGIRFYFRSYDGTVWLNLNHDLNAVSGTATITSGSNGLQHYGNWIIEELALMKGTP